MYSISQMQLRAHKVRLLRHNRIKWSVLTDDDTERNVNMVKLGRLLDDVCLDLRGFWLRYASSADHVHLVRDCRGHYGMVW